MSPSNGELRAVRTVDKAGRERQEEEEKEGRKGGC